MKNVIKFILSFICYVVMIPLLLALTIALTWYVLPAFQTTQLGILVSNQFPDQTVFLATLAICGCTVLFSILCKVFRVIKSSKPNNFYTHTVTWLLALVLAAEAVYTFFAAESLSSVAFELTLVRKIGIGVGVLGMLLYGILSPKLRIIVNRKIQAYDTAKELNAAGRTSVVWMQILKTLDFMCPELLLLGVLCFAFNFEIALYFIFIIAAFILPVIGNMICDKRVKVEAIRKEQEKADAQVNATAEAVADLLAQRGGNP